MSPKARWLKRLTFAGAAALHVAAWGAIAHAASADDLFREGYVAETGDRDLDRAIQIYQRAIAMAPTDAVAARAYARIGFCYEAMEKWADAERSFREVLKIPDAEVETKNAAKAGLDRISDIQDAREKARLAALYKLAPSSSSFHRPEPKNDRVTLVVELFTPGQNNLAPALESTKAQLSRLGYSTRETVSASPGIGFGIGYEGPLRGHPRFIGGAFLSYVAVPTAKGTLSFGSGDGSVVTIKQKMSFVRLLGTVQRFRAVSKTVAIGFRVAGGIGLAQTDTESSSPDGTNVSLPSGTSENIGFTWEAGPVLMIGNPRRRFTIGLSYTYFPSASINGESEKVTWHPFSAAIGMRF